MQEFAERRARFRALHESGCFAIPNPWDGGSAVRLAAAGFPALASTSAGAAWALGKADGEMSLEEVLAYLRHLCQATALPVNADFESGFSDSRQGVAENVSRCIETGVAGLSIEDRTGADLFPLSAAVDRVRAAREAIDHSGQDVILVARCEGLLTKTADLQAVVDRLNAFIEAGADCLYAPGLPDLESVAYVVDHVSKPVNANLTGTGLSVADMASVGVRRVSVGGALAKKTYEVFDGFVERLKTEGRLP